MSRVVAVEEVKLSLSELLDTLAPGDEVTLTRNRQPVAKLVAMPPHPRPAPGLGKGSILYMAPDFDGPLEDTKECGR
jgi:antitoxin (DNA-binding transcriptional repressor) of toxin-antitoxin stability system